MTEDPVLDFLEQSGVKGMKWGVRKDRTPGVHRKTDKEARKDAEEHARAKMFYGEGAGTRRKLIRESVEAKKKRDPNYGKAFDAHRERQDLSKHASKAVSERKRTDTKVKTKQRAGFIARKLTGEMGTQAAFTAATIAGIAFMASPKGRQVMNTARSKLPNIPNVVQDRKRKKEVKDLTNYFKRNS